MAALAASLGGGGNDGLVARVFVVVAVCSAFVLGRFTSGWGASHTVQTTTIEKLDGGSLRQPLSSSGDASAKALAGSEGQQQQQQHPWAHAYQGRGMYVQPGLEHLVAVAKQDRVQVRGRRGRRRAAPRAARRHSGELSVHNQSARARPQVTDKITKHTYQTLYSAILDMAPGAAGAGGCGPRFVRTQAGQRRTPSLSTSSASRKTTRCS